MARQLDALLDEPGVGARLICGDEVERLLAMTLESTSRDTLEDPIDLPRRVVSRRPR